MTEFLVSRSRRQDFLRCPRSRYWLHEAEGHGWEPVALGLPLVTGGSVHIGLARLLESSMAPSSKLDVEVAVKDAVNDYESRCAGRKFDLEELEDQSYVFNEQRALVEALVRVAGLRIVPRLLELYEVLEVERMDRVQLLPPDDGRGYDIAWRSIPDALLRSRADGDLYLLSWKTCAEYSQKKDQDARVDMQGVSEQWAIEERLGKEFGCADTVPWLNAWTTDHGAPAIRGVQMVYLVKGVRRRMSKEQAVELGSPDGEGMKKTSSPLIYGYSNDPSGMSAEYAFASDWRCVAPHPMRRSQWYPTGECPGDGRNHKRGGEWKSFPVWTSLSVKEWIGLLDSGRVTPEAGDPLEACWAMPTPHFRTREQGEKWLRQTRAAEGRVASDLIFLREYEKAIEDEDDPQSQNDLRGMLEKRLDETFPQNTEMCCNWFGRQCPCFDLCNGPIEVAEDPVGSGIYREKTQYAPAEEKAAEVGE